MNYRTFLVTFSATAALSAMAQSVVAPAIPRDEKIEQQVEQTLARMTLDEKIAVIHAQSKFSSPGVQNSDRPIILSC